MTINGGGGKTLLQLHPRKHKKEEIHRTKALGITGENIKRGDLSLRSR